MSDDKNSVLSPQSSVLRRIGDAALARLEAVNAAREQALADTRQIVRYLNGLGEAAGELRRHLLDVLRAGDIAAAETTLALMDDIFGLLVTVDYPDAVTHGLRRTTDLVRGVLERSRGDLTLTAQQMRLEAALRARNAE
ncbi:MAG: hypothetical protein LC793_15300 [Thermomicrobia bacterium]|nr:hypothetical protein [Thermomicrobia bacterium]